DAQEIITTYFTEELITSFGDPIPIETQFGLKSSCLERSTSFNFEGPGKVLRPLIRVLADLSFPLGIHFLSRLNFWAFERIIKPGSLIREASTPAPVPTNSGERALDARAISPTPTPRPVPTPAFPVTTLSSSMVAPTPTADRAAVVLPQNSHKVGTIAEAATAGIVALVVLISLVFYFKYSGKGARRGKTQLQALYSGEKDDTDPDPEMGSARVQEITCISGQGPRGHPIGRNSSGVEKSL
ncbi:hypothetical protein FRC00_008645, partial [Tulasnella sp. 408]